MGKPNGPIFKKKSKKVDTSKLAEAIQIVIDRQSVVKDENKIIGEKKDFIKQFMNDSDLAFFDTGKGAATIVASNSSNMNNDILMGILNDLAEAAESEEEMEEILSAIEYKPVINEEKLESLLYNNKISDKDLKPALQTTTSYSLRFKAPKKK